MDPTDTGWTKEHQEASEPFDSEGLKELNEFRKDFEGSISVKDTDRLMWCAQNMCAENERLRSVMGRMKELLEDIAYGNRISSPPISSQEKIAKKLLAELAGMDRKG